MKPTSKSLINLKSENFGEEKGKNNETKGKSKKIVKKISNKLENIEICLLKCEIMKENIEEFIESFGGKFVANPGALFFFIFYDLNNRNLLVRKF